MGRDWNKDAQREREKERQIDATRAKFESFSRNTLGTKTMSPTKTGLIPIIIFWCIAFGLTYVLVTQYQKTRQVKVTANGDLIISRSQDGHFYTVGTVNGMDVTFLVDTGASLVSVSEEFAQKALILGGVPTTFHTANGDRPGRIVDGVGVSIGPINASNIKVGVGLQTNGKGDALLGQSFLSKFDITLGKNQMVLKARQ